MDSVSRHLVPLGFTWCHLVSLVSLGFTWCHMASLGFTWCKPRATVATARCISQRSPTQQYEKQTHHWKFHIPTHLGRNPSISSPWTIPHCVSAAFVNITTVSIVSLKNSHQHLFCRRRVNCAIMITPPSVPPNPNLIIRRLRSDAQLGGQGRSKERRTVSPPWARPWCIDIAPLRRQESTGS